MTRTLHVLASGAVALVAAALATGTPQHASAATQAPVRLASLQAAKQPVVPGFYEGRTIRYFNYGPIELEPANEVAPIWSVTNGPSGQHNIVDVVPGEKGYTPLWQVVEVTWTAGASPRLLRSADDVRKAKAAGEVRLHTTSTVVNCPVLGFGQKRIAGFSAGHVIHYYDLGPVKVARGNDVVPLYAVSNGVPAQHNVTGDTIAVGQTAYPPLWGILQVTWKAGATKRLLTSYAAIRRARAAHEVTVAKTSLVVNCPIVP